MNHKQIVGMPVISIADGAKLGAIDRVFVDPAGMRIVGFEVRPEGARLSAEGPNLIDVDDVHALGHDALTLNDSTAVRGDRTGSTMAALVEGDELLKRKVVTEGGTYVGDVVGLDFDERSYRLAQVEVSPGFFKSNKHVPQEQIVNAGGEVVIVADAVCEPEGQAPVDMPSTDARYVVGDVTRAE